LIAYWHIFTEVPAADHGFTPVHFLPLGQSADDGTNLALQDKVAPATASTAHAAYLLTVSPRLIPSPGTTPSGPHAQPGVAGLAHAALRSARAAVVDVGICIDALPAAVDQGADAGALAPKQARPLAVSQVMPQAPQFALSECGSTHAPLHVCFGGQQPETHLAASQNVQGSGSTPHVLPHAPQLFGSVARLTHFVLHAV
jgi:hypothetical protein